MSKVKENIQEIYSLSPMQQGILYHSIQKPNVGYYFEQHVYVIRGELHIHAFKKAWQKVLNRHDILRTAFVWRKIEKPLQVVGQNVSLALHFDDWQTLSRDQQQVQLVQLYKKERENGFVLSKAPLMHLTLLQMSTQLYQLIWSYHHLILDGWSSAILLKEVFIYYQAYSRGQQAYLEPPTPYRNYINWIQKDLHMAKSFWQQYLQNFRTPIIWDIDRAPVKPNTSDDIFGVEHIRLSSSVTAALRSLAKQSQLTLNTIVQGAWALLASNYCRQKDLVLGIVVSGRSAPIRGLETMVGVFINALPLRVKVHLNMPLLQWLKELQENQVKLLQFEYTPLLKIQKWSDVPSDTPLFESIFAFENYPIDQILKQKNNDIEIEKVSSFGRTNYPLTVIVGAGTELSIRVIFSTRRFVDADVNWMLRHFQTLLTAIASTPHQLVFNVSPLTISERRRYLEPRLVSFTHDKCIHQVFEKQAAQYPEKIALTFREHSLTYQALNYRANQLAHYLQSKGIGPETTVGIYLDRSPELIVAILGVLKAGGAYVPLDKAFPKERNSWIIQDANVHYLLTSQRIHGKPSTADIETIYLDLEWKTISQESTDRCYSLVQPDNIAYIIYTSGSTGVPKGVSIPHKNIVRLLLASHEWYSFSDADIWTMFHSFAFDFSVWELWGALSYGARLVIVPYEVSRSAKLFYKLLVQEQVTILNQTPLAFQQLISIDAVLSDQKVLGLRCVIFGGEELVFATLQSWLASHGDQIPRLVNMYGITETTVHATYYPLTKNDITSLNASLIGKPLPDLDLYILDETLQAVPTGVSGVIYIGGSGLARGYYNRPALTAQKFIPHPFSAHERLYETGDLARYTPDGQIEFLGRVDHQVKIRGFRIELGEIEAVFRQHPAVYEVIVLVHDDVEMGNTLIAYIVPDPQKNHLIGELHYFLRTKLPNYMVPSRLLLLDALPLTSNGKIDRGTLYQMEGQQLFQSTEHYIAPRDLWELKITQIWEKVLSTHPISVQDSFFEVGGHSLLALHVLDRIQQAFDVDVPLEIMLQNPTIEHLAIFLRPQEEKINSTPLVAIQPQGKHAPFFLVHALGGSVVRYANLVPYLEDQPLYGLQLPGIYHEELHFGTVEEMASGYIRELQKHQPHGPYYLGGWSSGGFIALEIANQLQHAGEGIAFLTVLDTFPPPKEKAVDKVNLALLEFPQLVDYEEHIRKLPSEEQVNYILSQAKNASLVPPDLNPELALRILRAAEANAHAIWQYSPPVYQGEITLFLAEDGTDLSFGTYFWREHSTVNPKVYTVPGHHNSLFDEPHVKVLGHQLNICLKEAQELWKNPER